MSSGRHPNKAGEAQRKTRTASKPRTGKPRKSRKTAGTARETSRDPRMDFSPDEWQDMVAESAYFLAEARGFEGGSADEDWYEAEALLREQLARAEDEADEKTASGLDLSARDREDKINT